MKKETTIAISSLSLFVLVLIFFDVLSAPEKYNLQPTDTQVNNNSAQENINATLPDTNQNTNNSTATITKEILGKAGVIISKIEDVKSGKDLFRIRLENLEGDIQKRYLLKDAFPIGYVYEIEKTVPYNTVKKLLAEKISTSPVYVINETNTYGKHSLYLNNANTTDTIFLLIEFNTQTIGFEYPKANQLLFDPLFLYLTNTI